MEYQKVINLLDKTPNQPSKFRTKNCVEINDNSHMERITSMLKSSLCHSSDAYIDFKGTIRVPNTAAAAAAGN